MPKIVGVHVHVLPSFSRPNGATVNSDVDVNIGLELSEAFNLVDRCIVSKWQHFWDQEATGSHYRSIEKNGFHQK